MPALGFLPLLASVNNQTSLIYADATRAPLPEPLGDSRGECENEDRRSAAAGGPGQLTDYGRPVMPPAEGVRLRGGVRLKRVTSQTGGPVSGKKAF